MVEFSHQKMRSPSPIQCTRAISHVNDIETGDWVDLRELHDLCRV